jgi:hypothetical protein
MNIITHIHLRRPQKHQYENINMVVNPGMKLVTCKMTYAFGWIIEF